MKTFPKILCVQDTAHDPAVFQGSLLMGGAINIK